jgi:hypothetical protein
MRVLVDAVRVLEKFMRGLVKALRVHLKVLLEDLEALRLF